MIYYDDARCATARRVESLSSFDYFSSHAIYSSRDSCAPRLAAARIRPLPTRVPADRAAICRVARFVARRSLAPRRRGIDDDAAAEYFRSSMFHALAGNMSRAFASPLTGVATLPD